MNAPINITESGAVNGDGLSPDAFLLNQNADLGSKSISWLIT